MKPVTAETITPAQIRELRGHAVDAGDVVLWRFCDVALGGEDVDLGVPFVECLTRCAAVYSARQAAKDGAS